MPGSEVPLALGPLWGVTSGFCTESALLGLVVLRGLILVSPSCSLLTKCTIERGSPRMETDLYAEFLQLWAWRCLCPGGKEEQIRTN